MHKFKICNYYNPKNITGNSRVRCKHSLWLENQLIEDGIICLKYAEKKIILSKFYLIWGESLM